MTEREEIKDLIKKRGSYKGRLTVFSTYLSGLSDSLSTEEVCELQLRIDRLNSLFGQYDEVQLRLECLANDAAQVSERTEFETTFYKSIGKAQALLSRNSKNNFVGSDNISVRGNHNLVSLPAIQIPKFSGSYENWLEFRDTFNSLVHSSETLDDINKFHYLRGALEGKAAGVLKSIEFCAKNYKKAWEVLCDRFENKHLLIQKHVNALFNIEPFTKESCANINRIIDELIENLHALESLGEPTKHWDTLLIRMMSHKLDPKTYRVWEELKSKRAKNERITLSIFLEFMRSRADFLETLDTARDYPHSSKHKNNNLRTMVSVSNDSQHKSISIDSNNVNKMSIKLCPNCNGDHNLKNCAQFLALSNEDRLKLLPKFKVCFNCFKTGHYANRCKKSGCTICKRKHNTLIHSSEYKHMASKSSHSDGGDKSTVPTAPAAVNEAIRTNDVTLSCVASAPSALHTSDGTVLLSTALVKLYDNNHRSFIARAVLDCGSTSCLITEDLWSKLKLPTLLVDKSLLGVNNSLSQIGKMVYVPIKSLDENYSNKLLCFVLPKITGHLPSRQINLSTFNIPSDVCLADPNFYKPSTVDLIIGADIFWDLLGSRNIRLGDGNPILYETQLGWIVSGPTGGQALNSSHYLKCNFTELNKNDNELLNDDIQLQLTRFWQLEEISHKSSYYSKEERMCEQHFIENTTRLQDGRFCVRIPLKQPQDVLGNSLQRAKHCLLSLERRIKNQNTFRKSYCDFMSEYLSLGHMSKCEYNPQQLAYFIPHHGVLRECSTTTKLRVVFNASSPTSSGVSLNNIQLVGPTIQEDLLSILIRFRQHKYILAADIEKMYRQVVVHPSDRHLQQIVWRDDPSDHMKVYQLNTVTYGTASAPFLAIRCLKQIGMECDDSKIAEIITHDFYVDDLLTGGDSILEVLNIKQKVTAALADACMPLRKFRSNSPELMLDSQSSVDLNIGSKEPSKTLGLGWRTETDELCFSVSTDLSKNHTKRSILSVIGQIFDPMGLLAPCVISMKIFLQKLWLSKLSWDDELPTESTSLWQKIIQSLPVLNEMRIPRMVIGDSNAILELHIFSDASQNAYGSCVYIRSVDKNDHIVVRLLLAKTRVAPIKPVTIPRLELCGALIGAQLYEKVIHSIRCKFRHVTFWTDSMVVLGWLNLLPSKLQPFVRNRVAEIIDKTNNCTWRHVCTHENPADLISRGENPNIIKSSRLWWHGPEFLTQSVKGWPSTKINVDKLPEVKSEVSLHITTDDKCRLIDLSRFSNLLRLQRAVGYVLRFVSVCKKKTINNKHLSENELQSALNLIIKSSQNESFAEYELLLNNKSLPLKSPLIKYNVFLDENELMRVGGRLENSDYSYDKKHPLIIHSSHPFTKLLFHFTHKKLMHAGPQLLLATIRENYWPIGGRNLAKLVYRKCVLCSRMRGKVVTPLMGNLPQQRLSSSHPFENVGVDYAGPILAANRQGRGCKLIKVYIAIFICFATKAIHIELVGDLTSDNFISALRRFMSRRGKPKNLYSDNGTSFVGACNEIGKFLRSSCGSLSEPVANEGIMFHFLPPHSPHFGGLWEAGVKSTKYHLRRVLGNCHLTYEELNTVLVQIEALLNSRPLTPLSASPNDLLPLTPAHFLIGRTFTSLPTPNYEDYSASRLNRYQRIEQLRQHFWSRWSKEFISELQQRTKWRSSSGQLKMNSLVVLKDDNLPPLKWKLGRIIALHPGLDGINRVADIRTASGVTRRAFSKICPLFEEDG